MNSSFDVTTIIFAALALFVVWKLRSVLGSRTGHERQPDQPSGGDRQKQSDSDKIVRLPNSHRESANELDDNRSPPDSRWDGIAARDSDIWRNLDKIDQIENGFDAHEFIAGAKSAYEMIITAFAAGDRNILRDLLDDDVYKSFSAAISERASNEQRVETTFVSIDDAKIRDIILKNKTAQITMAFDSKLITATFDRENKLIDGDAEKIVDVADVWTYARELGSGNPNWLLVAT